jgi:hypothetical protein
MQISLFDAIAKNAIDDVAEEFKGDDSNQDSKRGTITLKSLTLELTDEN